MIDLAEQQVIKWAIMYNMYINMATTSIIFLINNMSNMPIHMYFAIQLPINNKCKILLLYPKVLDICIMQLVHIMFYNWYFAVE